MQFSAIFSLIFKNDYGIIKKNKRNIKCIDNAKWRGIINLKLNNTNTPNRFERSKFFYTHVSTQCN
jgi:hypothetical protein